MKTYDYIVVGGGSSGCVAAAELARANRSVLLLECGETAEANPETLRADGYKDAFANDRVIWERFSAPQKNCRDLRVFMGSGTGMGGSGSVNGMVYTRGAAADYAEWPRGWRWEDVRSDFEAIEMVIRPNRRAPTEFTEACVRGAEEAGFRRKDDLNDGDLCGVIGYEWMNYEGDARRSSYVAFVRDGSLRTLTVETGARAEKLDIDAHKRVTGVTYLKDGKRLQAKARHEVVLCAGALETPKLLMLSGVGPTQALRNFEIPVVLDAPGVGGNLHDHPNVPLFFAGGHEVDCRYPQLYSFHRANPDSELPRGQSDTCYVYWPARSSMKEAMKRILPSKVLPESLYEAHRGKIRAGVDLAFRSAALQRFIERMYGIVIILGKPKSRGRLSLRSRDVAEQARIDPAYYQNPEDMQTMLKAVRIARNVAASSSMSRFGNRELMPGKRVTSDEKLARFIEENTITTYHFAGTCRMGEDAASVTDTRLLFRGLRGLRIGDASVIPTTPVSALNAPSMLVGYRAAKF
ncbi:MAG: GMC family oxidoreductase, partial [Polyangiaceae bacterium]|nr:GMC family oxidoreductase [Polyangiaceae bacterium]